MKDLGYSEIRINKEQAEIIAHKYYNINGDFFELPGELDFNFKIKTQTGTYVLKVSRPDVDRKFIDYQLALLSHIVHKSDQIISPKVLINNNGNTVSQYKDNNGQKRWVRLYTWVDGRLWSSVNPHSDSLLFSLGRESGITTKLLSDFDHLLAHRKFEWDICQAEWTLQYMELFDNDIKPIINYYQNRFLKIKSKLSELRKGVIHNDINDNNIIVSKIEKVSNVTAIIDYGDAIYTAQINNLAVTIAYAIMGKPEPLQAAILIIQAYHQTFQLHENELELLYVLVAMRLVISLTKSAINKQHEPDNTYLQVSEKPALDLLNKWYNLNESFVTYSFRAACGYVAHPLEKEFIEWALSDSRKLADMFPTLEAGRIFPVDMSVSSTWLGNKHAYNDNSQTTLKIRELYGEFPDTIIAGGYGEIRPFYSSDIFKKEGNNGPEYRTVHLGIDFWLDEKTPIHSLFDGIVHSIHTNKGNKDYGPTLILKHNFGKKHTFYTLYGHLTISSLKLFKVGDHIQKGGVIAYVGNEMENGNWSPHLHFQIMLDMMGYEVDFPGVAFPAEMEVWKSICPDPELLFKADAGKKPTNHQTDQLVALRKKRLGENLSLSYQKPLKIVRGEGVFLIDDTGRKYLDTVNNVAHVGHEHYRVVEAGQKQMAVLNTNTRYLHNNIIEFAEDLLDTFPEELSVVFIVNSGSEANELALRMAKSFTGQKDMIAVEAGYHGNTNACIDVSSYKFDSEGGNGCPENTHIVPLPDTFRGIYQGMDAGEKYANHIEKQIENIRNKGRNVAAFICESIISCGGQIELPENYLKIAYKAVQQAGGLCIADEVQVGCGRVGSVFWGFQLHDVVPDIVSVGKPIGNGHPLAAVVCTKKVADAFNNGMEYFNTFGGNPVSCAIGKEVLSVIKDENLQENALRIGNYLKDRLFDLQKDFPLIGNVRGQGLFLGFELNGKNKEPLAEKANYLANRMRDFAILMSTDGPDHNVLKIKPPLVFSKKNANELINRLSFVLKEDFMITDVF